MRGYEPIALLGDAHVIEHDERAVRAACGALRALRPPRLCFMGDQCDFEQLGKFLKSPARLGRLEEEVLETKAVNEQLLDAAGAEGHVVLSNHYDRVRKEVWAKNPELAFALVEPLTLGKLLGYRDLGVTNHGWLWQVRPWFVLKHGDTIRKWAGRTAHAELANEGLQGASGHTHRLCAYPRRYRDQVKWWCETGCLCENPMAYRRSKGVTDWQQGFAIAWLHPRKQRVRFELVPIEDGEAFWRGRSFSA